MKLTKAALLENIKKNHLKAILIYGPDSGMSRIIERNIILSLGLSKESYDYADLNIGSIHSLLKTRDLFSQNACVKISNVPQSIPADLKNILSGNLAKFAIFTADDLQKNSSMRKFFESEPSLGILPCYIEEPNVVAQNIRARIVKAGKQISGDAMLYLSNTLVGDSLYLENEIEKLLIYSENKQSISLEDAESVISSEITTSPDKLCIAFASGDQKTYLHELNKLLEENISAIWIIRALIRYYMNLYFVSKKISEGSPLDSAINSMVPPIFFKHLPDFKKNLATNKIDQIKNVLDQLQKAEKSCKTTLSDPRNICEMLPSLISNHSPYPTFVITSEAR
jgi:DNA polymerase-3 subunit delta